VKMNDDDNKRPDGATIIYFGPEVVA